MPLPLSVPVGLLLGMSLAWIARAELALSEVPLVLARPFLVALGLGAIVFGPIEAYFVAMHGDWAYLYLVPTHRVPSAVDLSLVVLCAAQVPLGFALTSRWAIARRPARFLKAGIILGTLGLVASLVASKRLGVSASYAQYHGGFGIASLAETPLGRGVLLSWGALLAGFAWCVRVLRAPHPR